MKAICAEPSRGRGFTLIEAMVALLIVSLGMLAVSAQLGRFAAATYTIEEKTLASWIAANKITELSISSAWPELGTQQEEIEFAQREWRLRTEVTAIPDVENLRRVDVYIMHVEDLDQVVHQSTGLLEPPPPQGGPGAARGYGRSLGGQRG